MRKTVLLGCLLLCDWLASSAQTSYPQARISNGKVRATLYLPDPERGCYRGSRFDWSGVVSSLEANGHNYFGVWFPHYDPRLHDAISGPVEEFRSGDLPLGGALGFEEAKPGEGFVKIGVGVLRRPDAGPYSFAKSYEIMNHGVWTSRPQADRIEFVQELKDDSGYSYVYEKTVRLVSNRNELILEHRLKNTGKRLIETDVYDHDFYMLDGQPTGPGVVVKFAFAPQLAKTQPSDEDNFTGKVQIRANEVIYTRELQNRESASGFLTGFGDEVADNDISVENTRSGAGVREIWNRPLKKLFLWSIRTTVCPEAYIHMKIAPGQEFKWKIRYLFYTTGK